MLLSRNAWIAVIAQTARSSFWLSDRRKGLSGIVLHRIGSMVKWAGNQIKSCRSPARRGPGNQAVLQGKMKIGLSMTGLNSFQICLCLPQLFVGIRKSTRSRIESALFEIPIALACIPVEVHKGSVRLYIQTGEIMPGRCRYGGMATRKYLLDETPQRDRRRRRRRAQEDIRGICHAGSLQSLARRITHSRSDCQSSAKAWLAVTTQATAAANAANKSPGKEYSNCHVTAIGRSDS